MNLLKITSRYYFFIFLIILSLFSLLFYWVLKLQVEGNIDEALHNRRNQIIRLFHGNGGIPSKEIQIFSDFRIHPIAKWTENDIYRDTLIYEPTDDEFDEYRKLITSFSSGKQLYKLEIVKPHLESTEIISTISITLVSIYILLVGAIYFASRALTKKLWNPFYRTLNELENYRVDEKKALAFPKSDIEEFDTLNETIHQLTERNHKVFEAQKQFIENASHEMQTPLAVIHSKLELLLEDPDITKAQAELSHEIILATEKITRLNKALLLLSKIENKQFMDKQTIVINPIIHKSIELFYEQAEKYDITVEIDLKEEITVNAHPVLTEVILSNLIKNAFVHNISHGKIYIKGKSKELLIKNTGKATAIPEDKIFERFYKQSSNQEGWGLGLAIVKTICEVNEWKLRYSHYNQEHIFHLTF